MLPVNVAEPTSNPASLRQVMTRALQSVSPPSRTSQRFDWS